MPLRNVVTAGMAVNVSGRCRYGSRTGSHPTPLLSAKEGKKDALGVIRHVRGRRVEYMAGVGW